LGTPSPPFSSALLFSRQFVIPSVLFGRLLVMNSNGGSATFHPKLSIPRHGEVTQTQYETFRQHFLRAFEKSSRTGGVPTATRLLAMKRPDSFVCVSNPNKAGLANALAFSRTKLDLDNYWERSSSQGVE
jgi:hypothetical protein